MSGTMGSDFGEIFCRELDRLKSEIEAYEDESALWLVLGGQKNAPGTLVLHLAGNLMHFIGAELGGIGYVRDREAEFSDRDVSRAELLRRIAACRATIAPILEALSDDVMETTYPGTAPSRMVGITTRAFLLHLTWHIGWHLGHIYYHRLALASD